MASIELERTVSPGNDLDIYVRLRKRNPAAPAKKIAATGLAVTAILSATEDGGAIAGTGTILVPETAVLGDYFGSLPGSTLTTALAAIADGTELYIIVTAGTNIRRVFSVVVMKNLPPDNQ